MEVLVLITLIETSLLRVMFLAAGLIVVVVDDGFLGTLEAAAHHTHAGAHAEAGMAEAAVQEGFDAFKGQGAGSNAGGGLHGSTEETGLAGGDVLRLRVLRIGVNGWGRRRRHVGLLSGCIGRRSGIAMAEQVAEKAGGVCGLTRLLELLFELPNLSLGLIEGEVLDQHGLGQNIERIRIRR